MNEERLSNLFPPLTELAADASYIGQALGKVPPWLLREAERWDDPWNFLLECPPMPKPIKRVLKAAQSQKQALIQLALTAIRGSTVHTGWAEEAKVKSHSEQEHAIRKILRALWGYDAGERLLAGANSERRPALVAEVRRRFDELSKLERRRVGRVKENRPRVPVLKDTDTNRIACELAVGWLRVASGLPGYGFFSDAALVSVLDCLFDPGLAALRQKRGYKQATGIVDLDTLRKVRQRVGLRKAQPFICDVQMSKDGSTELIDDQGESLTVFLHPFVR